MEQLPDVESVAVGVDGIVVDTANPDALPLSIEGVPIIPAPSFGRPIKEIPYAEVSEGLCTAEERAVAAPRHRPRAGISSKDASVMFERDKETRKQWPGGEEVMMGSDGIGVSTEHPEWLPEELEELPIRAFPPIE